MRQRAFVGIGANLAGPARQVRRAVAALRRLPATHFVAVSPLYRSAPVGCLERQPDYVNAVAVLSTQLGPWAMLRALQRLERRMGRIRRRRNAPRRVDLDLLLYGQRRVALSRLQVPHPRLHERAFALVPLSRLAPAARIPGRGRARALASRCRGQRLHRIGAR